MQTEADTYLHNPNDLVEDNEHVLVVVRKHWAGIAQIYIISGLLVAALVLIGTVVIPDLRLSDEAKSLVMVGALVIFILMTLILLAVINVYYRSKLTLTDKSLVQVVQSTLFSCKTSRLSMSNVEDVNVEQRGIISSLFNFGTLTVQTAGQEDNFVFSFCPQPNVYAERILQARQAYAQHYPHASE
jgi:membrane protein YdbS with pleckstrin-like domain